MYCFQRPFLQRLTLGYTQVGSFCLSIHVMSKCLSSVVQGYTQVGEYCFCDTSKGLSPVMLVYTQVSDFCLCIHVVIHCLIAFNGLSLQRLALGYTRVTDVDCRAGIHTGEGCVYVLFHVQGSVFAATPDTAYTQVGDCDCRASQPSNSPPKKTFVQPAD